MHTRMQNSPETFATFKKVSPQTKKNEDLNTKVLDNAGDFFNKLHCIQRYKDKKDVLNKKDVKKFDCTKLRLINGYLYESEKK